MRVSVFSLRRMNGQRAKQVLELAGAHDFVCNEFTIIEQTEGRPHGWSLLCFIA